MRVLMMILLLALAGCAEVTSIYHNRPVVVSKAIPSIVTIDAKQRNVFFTMVGDKLRLCAEASPDAFSALAASASLDADVTAKKARAAGALAETVGTIERTQTINLLRESMYRTCERYLSGAIDESAFVIQAARDQRAMVAVLAIEQLTRVARPPSTILVPASTSASVVNGDAMAELIGTFAKERTDAKKALDAATTSYDAALEKGKCVATTTAPADETGDPKFSDWSACKKAELIKAQRQTDFTAADGELDKLLASGAASPTTTSASTGTAASTAGGSTVAVSETTLAVVAEAVKTIANSPNIDEPLMFCIAALKDKLEKETAEMCREIIRLRSKQDNDIRAGLLLSGGQHIQSTDYSPSPASEIIAAYLKSPTKKAEQRRRLGLANMAATKAGAPHGNDLIPYLMSGNSVVHDKMLALLRALETNAVGKAQLEK